MENHDDVIEAARQQEAVERDRNAAAAAQLTGMMERIYVSAAPSCINLGDVESERTRKLAAVVEFSMDAAIHYAKNIWGMQVERSVAVKRNPVLPLPPK